MKYINKINYVIAMVLLSLFSMGARVHEVDIKVFTGKSKADLSAVRSFFRTSDILISRILPKKRCRQISYSIVLMNKKEFKKPQIMSTGNTKLRVYLPEDISKWNDNHEVFSNLIASAILKKSGISSGENYQTVPKWLTYAIVNKILRRSNDNIIPGTVSFPGIHALVVSGDEVDWIKTISHPMKPEDGPAYQVFLDSSEIILDGILRLPDGKQVLFDIIELSNKDLDPADLFKGAIIKKIDKLQGTVKNDIFDTDIEPDILKGWLEYIFKLSSVNVMNPCNASFSEKLFIDHQLVKYYAKTGKDENSAKEERYCKIEELPDKVKEITDIKSVILKKQRDLVRIAFAMPIPLQTPVYKMEKSLNLILAKKLNEFKKEYATQKINFYNNLEKQHKVEVYILKTEEKFVPPGFRYSNEYMILQKIKDQNRKRWPELHEYLDTFSE